MIFASVSTAIASRATATGPDLPSGDWVGFTCPKGYVSLAGTQVCNNGFNTLDVCNSASCSAALVGTADSGYSFKSWETSGDASVVCSTCSSTTLKTTDPNGLHYSGTVSECMAGSVSFTSSFVTQATNATIYFDPTLPPGCSTTVTVTLTWGNTTSYPFTAVSKGQYASGSQYSVFLDYLQPGKTYDYKLVGTSTGFSQGTLTGSNTTGSEQSYFNTWGTTIRGLVHDVNNNPAPPGVYVEVTCTAGNDFFWGTTNSVGAYDITVVDSAGKPACSDSNGYYVVQVLTMPHLLGTSGQYSTQWSGRWNETIVVWDLQFVNLFLPINYVSGYIPMTFDFTNSTYVLFTVTTSSTLTTSESYARSVQGAIHGIGVGGGTSYSSSAFVTTQSSYPGVTGDSYEMLQEYDVSGTEVFSMLNRAVTLFPEFYEPSGSISSGPTSLADWLTRPACNSNPGVVYCIDFEGSQPYSNSMTSGGSYTLSSSFNLGITGSPDIPGIGTLSASVSDSYTTTLTSVTSYTVSFTVSSPSNVCYGFEYEFQGDNSGTSGVVAHVWNLGDQPLGNC